MQAQSLLIGRERQLAALARAFAAARDGVGVGAGLRGEPGAGKTALARAFVESLPPGALVLSGRCFDRQDRGFQAFAGPVAALGRHLRAMAPERRARLWPADGEALGSIFPPLALATDSRSDADPQQRRRRAFAALCSLLDAVAAEQPVVLLIDDLQWADADSAALLSELVRPRAAPCAMHLLSWRSDDEPRSPAVQAVLAAAPAIDRVEVTPLGAADSEALALTRLGSDDPATRDFARAIAREANGNPFLLNELARWVQSQGGFGEEVTLDRLIAARLASLAPEAQKLAATIAVAGRPTERALLLDAASAGEAALQTLLDAHLVRVNAEGAVEALHDRVRETLHAQLDPELRRRCHADLAQAYRRAHADDETLALHLRDAGQPESAARHAAIAGLRASSALAFDRAARLYGLALTLAPPGREEACRLRAQQAEALAYAGHGRDAAAAYLAAATDAADDEQALDLRQKALDQILRAGDLERAVPLARELLAAVGVGLPDRAIILRILAGRARLAMRGMRFRERDASQVDRAVLRRIDVCRSVAAGLGMFEPLRVIPVQARAVRDALDAGEPTRVAFALAVEAGLRSLGGARARDGALAIMQRALEAAKRAGQPQTHAFVHTAASIVDIEAGEWRTALEHGERGEAIARECRGAGWELHNARQLMGVALFYLGELGKLARLVPAWAHDADVMDDLFGMVHSRLSSLNAAWLVTDEPQVAEERIASACGRLPAQPFVAAHFYELLSRVNCDLYRGDAGAAWERIDRGWEPARRTMLLRIEVLRVEATCMRGRAALARAAIEPAKRERLLAAAETAASRLVGIDRPYAHGLGALLTAGAAAARNAGDAADQLRRAADACEAADMRAHAAAARWRAAELGDDSALAASARSFFSDQGVKQPERWRAMLAP